MIVPKLLEELLNVVKLQTPSLLIGSQMVNYHTLHNSSNTIDKI